MQRTCRRNNIACNKVTCAGARAAQWLTLQTQTGDLGTAAGCAQIDKNTKKLVVNWAHYERFLPGSYYGLVVSQLIAGMRAAEARAGRRSAPVHATFFAEKGGGRDAKRAMETMRSEALGGAVVTRYTLEAASAESDGTATVDFLIFYWI